MTAATDRTAHMGAARSAPTGCGPEYASPELAAPPIADLADWHRDRAVSAENRLRDPQRAARQRLADVARRGLMRGTALRRAADAWAEHGERALDAVQLDVPAEQWLLEAGCVRTPRTFAEALARVRETHRRRSDGRLVEARGHATGRPESRPSVVEVLAARAAAPGLSVSALARALDCDRSLVNRRLVTARCEDALCVALLAGGGMGETEARAAVTEGRAQQIAEARR